MLRTITFGLRHSGGGAYGKDIRMLTELYSPIEKGLERVEQRLKKELSSENPFVSTLLGQSSKFHGKRLRPALLLYSAEIFGGITDVHIGLSAVVEMIHNATLVHDDVLDEADRRRNVQTLNAMSGNEASVLFGDYLFAKAFALCARLDCTEANVLLADTTEMVCVGELTQIATKFNPDLDEDRYLQIIRQKTASLFAAACRLGGVGSGAERVRIDSMADYGRNFGTAFQIVDDCLDLTGDEKVVGKSLGTDLDKGKLTLPIILLLRALPERRRRELRDLLASSNGMPDRRPRVLKLLAENGIVDAAMRRAHDFVEEARSALRAVGDSALVEHLEALLEFSLQRRR